jgi:hypothetical protein
VGHSPLELLAVELLQCYQHESQWPVARTVLHRLRAHSHSYPPRVQGQAQDRQGLYLSETPEFRVRGALTVPLQFAIALFCDRLICDEVRGPGDQAIQHKPDLD